MEFSQFFEMATGRAPFPYQASLAKGDWPHLIDVPTGLGKTAAVTLAWLWRLHERAPTATRRLVYCLPMRVLVEQTRDAVQAWVERLGSVLDPAPTVHLLLGGDADDTWDAHPEKPAILIGTQDMILSRALNRGYGVSRYRWPVHFGLLHNDATWVFDETQLMGVGVETSAQLQGLRDRLGTLLPTQSVWMSATLGRQQLETVDHPSPAEGWRVQGLAEADRKSPTVVQRTQSRKLLQRAAVSVSKAGAMPLAEIILERHQPGTLTLVVVNRVPRAQELLQALRKRGRTEADSALVHARFRAHERRRGEQIMLGKGDRIVVATQAVEAGVDVSARTLFTELAPWSSLVQRFGRCNRYGEHASADVFWIDIPPDADEKPYEREALDRARVLLQGLEDVGPDRLPRQTPQAVVRPVLRRKDLIDLFDTTPDLSGNDLDVSPYIRDGDDTDVSIFWRPVGGSPPPDLPAPDRAELCAVSIGSAKDFAKKQELWRFDALDGRWRKASSNDVRPGQVLLADVLAGGYDESLGWLGAAGKKAVTPLAPHVFASNRAMDDDRDTCIGRWVPLLEHLGDTAAEARAVARSLGLAPAMADAVETAAAWHDLGKAHEAFQSALPEAPAGDVWAKSASPTARLVYRVAQGPRPGFRHELASALAWVQANSAHPYCDLVAYLVAAHHGKVRLSIRSMPNESAPTDDRLFARGIWDGDLLPAVSGYLDEALSLSLSLMQLGDGSWLSRTLQLRDDAGLGPFRLAILETLVRVADWRASRLEESRVAAHA